jgi:hypothetical protein
LPVFDRKSFEKRRSAHGHGLFITGFYLVVTLAVDIKDFFMPMVSVRQRIVILCEQYPLYPEGAALQGSYPRFSRVSCKMT